MPGQPEKYGRPNNNGSFAARIQAGQPVYAWGDPKVKYPGPDASSSLEEGKTSRDHHRRRLRQQRNQTPFYDREALQEQLRGLQVEAIDLSEKEKELGLRLANAQATLSSMREKKRGLSQAKALDEVASLFPPKATSVSRAGKYGDIETMGGCSNRQKARSERRQEEANFAAQDRIMELELLNNKLSKGQAEVERDAKAHQAASSTTRAEVRKLAERLKAMPKRFTQSLQQLRDEVEKLESEKLTLQLAKEQRTSKEADLLASAKRQKAYLSEELTSLLDEIDDVEEDRDRWKRRLRAESARAESLRCERDEALRALRERFGSDAVERAAFALFSTGRRAGPKGSMMGRSGRREGDRGSSVRERENERGDDNFSAHGDGDGDDGGGGGGGGEDEEGGFDDVEVPKIPMSLIAKSLRPAYGPDCDHDNEGGGRRLALLTDEAVAEAVLSECGIDCSAEMKEGDVCLGIGFEEYRAVAKRLVKKSCSESGANGVVTTSDEGQS